MVAMWALACVLNASSTAAAENSPRLLDGFDDLSPWTALASDGVTASAAPADGVGGRAMRLNFDFASVAGYAFARRALPLDLPENYEISFLLRAEAPVNTFEVKFTDGSGENVWWSQRRDFTFPADWRRIKIKKRHIGFAWGPTQDRVLRRVDNVEFVVTAGRDGGTGWIEIDDLTIRELPPEPTTFPAPVASALSSSPGAEPSRALDGDMATAWKSAPTRDIPRSFTLDLGMVREFGGLDVRWADDAFAARYDVSLSEDGVDWQAVRRVVNGNGGRDPLALPEAEARFVRLDLHEGPRPSYALADVRIKDLSFGASPNAFVADIAREARRGLYPRAFVGEQPYWTVVGIDGGGESGLLSEDGALEVGRGGVSIEPFVVTGSELSTWADVEISQSLRDGYLPIPSVAWRHPNWDLGVTAFAEGGLGNSRLFARYRVTNRADERRSLKLALAVRPFQVNPPTQSLNVAGGVSPIKSLRWDGAKMWVNGEAKIAPLTAPDSVAARGFDSGAGPDELLQKAVAVPPLLASPAWGEGPVESPSTDRPSEPEQSTSLSRAAIPPPLRGRSGGGEPGTAAVEFPKAAGPDGEHDIDDDTGLASGVLVYDLDLGPHETATVGLVVPLAGESALADRGDRPVDAWIAEREDAVAATWREKLDRVAFEVPSEARHIVDTLRSSLAHILMSRNGPILQPGTRSYNRSWIRDGAMMAESLARLGHAHVAADYLRWFAPHQFANGKVPCCVDSRGADPVPENDSHGQLIFLAAEVFRYTGDRSLLDAVWPRVDAATRYMDELRASERTEANRAPERRMLYGLFPPSISHEGYAAKPAYSYWDGFWGLLGYKDAVMIASALGKDEAAQRLARERDAFRADLMASLRASAEVHRIPYLPGAADLGDFDATSTTIALAPGGEREHLPDDLLLATFERYWLNFADRRDGKKAWHDYTPYELRAVGAFVRLGWRERAHELLDFFFKDQRPRAWNQWAEVVGRVPREPRFIGDMPHAWISSDYIRSAIALFAYERHSDASLVLAAGIPAAWLDGTGIAVRNLRTPHGAVSYALAREGDGFALKISGDAKPPGGFVLPPPSAGAWRATRRDGTPVPVTDGAVKIDTLPADIVMERAPPPERHARD